MFDYIVVGIIVVVIAIAALVALTGSGRSNSLPVTKKALMTKRERAVLPFIEANFPGCRIHSQVAMAALIKLQSGVEKKKRMAIRNRFDRKIIDFVVEQKQTGDVIALIELDDRTHNAQKDAARDAITATAGYKTIRIPAGTKLNAADVGEILSAA